MNESSAPAGLEESGVIYCDVHNGVMDEDSSSCDFRHQGEVDPDTDEPYECDPEPLYRLLPEYRTAKTLRVEVYGSIENWDDQIPYHRWRVVHVSNGETMASGEGYADRRDRDHAVALLFPGVPVEEVEG